MSKLSVQFNSRFIIRTMIAVVALTAIGFCSYQTYFAKEDFNNYAGSGDYWRIPLQYPYEISIVDTFDYAALTQWKNSTSIVWPVQKYAVKNSYLIGVSISRDSGALERWFLFDMNTGSIQYYSTEQEFLSAWKSLCSDPMILDTKITKFRG